MELGRVQKEETEWSHLFGVYRLGRVTAKKGTLSDEDVKKGMADMKDRVDHKPVPLASQDKGTKKDPPPPPLSFVHQKMESFQTNLKDMGSMVPASVAGSKSVCPPILRSLTYRSPIRECQPQSF